MTLAGPAVGLTGIGVDRWGHDILHRQAVGRGAAQLVCGNAVDQDLFGCQSQAKGHLIQQFAVTSPARVHDDSIVGIIQRL